MSQDRIADERGRSRELSYVKGIHNVKAGVVYEQTFLTENDHFGIVDPTLNALCLDADGIPVFVGNPGLNDPTQCADSAFDQSCAVSNAVRGECQFRPDSGLHRPDADRTPSAADGCGTASSATHFFHGHTDVKQLALYVQDTITVKNWSFNVGIRGDIYNGLSKATQAEPRLGVAYNIKQSNTVLRISYARTLESPFNENLVLSSRGCLDAVVANLFAATGEGCTNATTGAVNIAPSTLPPGYRNEFHAGLQQAFGKYLVVDGEYIWKYTHNAYDFSILGATPITFPIAWNNSKIPGYAIRANVPNYHGFTALVVMSSVAARFFTPQIGGVGAVPITSAVPTPFRIDHDEKFNLTAHLQYQFAKRGPWVGFNWRYDSGLVAGPVPCAGGNCCQRPDRQRHGGGCFDPYARPAISGRAFLHRQRYEGVCHADDAYQPQFRLSCGGLRFDEVEDTAAGYRGRRSQPAARASAQLVRRRHWARCSRRRTGTVLLATPQALVDILRPVRRHVLTSPRLGTVDAAKLRSPIFREFLSIADRNPARSHPPISSTPGQNWSPPPRRNPRRNAQPSGSPLSGRQHPRLEKHGETRMG